jgi:hypothetical protein
MSSALSISPYAAGLLSGPLRRGRALGHGFAVFGEEVIAVTAPGAPRMPNGIEGELPLSPGDMVLVGEGALRSASATLAAGPTWDPRPTPRVSLRLASTLALDVDRLVGWGPGLTPLGDDILAGRLAARALRGREADVPQPPGATTALSRTLLRRAALGELPEPAHRLLEEGDPEPLLHFGASSGRGILLGLACDGAANGGPWCRSCSFGLPLPNGWSTVEVLAC